MKTKYVFVFLISILLLVALFQIAPIPPYADDILPLYKSGYFRELDREFHIIADAFIAIKSMSRSEYAWIYLNDVASSYEMSIAVFDHHGNFVPAPGEKKWARDPDVLEIMNAANPTMKTETRGGRYRAVIPFVARSECRICHRRMNERGVVGAIRFERGYDAHVYYSLERVMIFSVIAMILGMLLYAILRWDPGKSVKELFDK